MPIYEYACPRCREIFSFLVRSISSRKKLHCPKCGSSDLKRIYSPFATIQSEADRLEKMSDPSFFSGLDEKDPRSLARLMKKMARETGEEMDEEMKAICERLEAGEDPEKLEDELGGTGPGDYRRDPSGRLYE
jgi:putative FmdB family regulatory protein